MGLFSGSYEHQVKHILSKIEKQLKQNDVLSASFSYQILSKMAEENNLVDDAIKYTGYAADLSLKANKLYIAGWHYRELANLYFKKSDYQKTIESAVMSAECLLKENSKYAAQWSYNLAAKAAEAAGDLYSAIRYFKRSLELEEDMSIVEEVEKLIKKIPHPTVIEEADKKEAKEGEVVEFKITLKNKSNETLKNVRLVGKENNVGEIEYLEPQSEKTFSFKTACMVGIVKPCYSKVAWENILGDKFEQGIGSAAAKGLPDIELIVSCNPQLILNKISDFIIIAKNKSTIPIKHAEFFASFPSGLKVVHQTKKSFESIGPGETGVVFSIKPTIIGELKVDGIKLSYKDDFGSRNEIFFGSFVSPVGIEEGNLKKGLKVDIGVIEAEYLKQVDKRKSEITVVPHPISEEEHLRLSATFFPAHVGFTLESIPVEHLSSHIMDICRQMAFIGAHKLEGERLFLFSGVDIDTIYLLTVAIKQDGGLLNVLFKAYSNKKECVEKFLKNISELIKYTSLVTDSAKEVEKIEVTQVIKIIDSVVQRSQIGASPSTDKSISVNRSDV